MNPENLPRASLMKVRKPGKTQIGAIFELKKLKLHETKNNILPTYLFCVVPKQNPHQIVCEAILLFLSLNCTPCVASFACRYYRVAFRVFGSCVRSPIFRKSRAHGPLDRHESR